LHSRAPKDTPDAQECSPAETNSDLPSAVECRLLHEIAVTGH
jgi:hypothetical protein